MTLPTGKLGATMTETSKGVVVTNVKSGSIAEQVGIRSGDVITFVNGTCVAPTMQGCKEVRRLLSTQPRPTTIILRRRVFSVVVEKESDDAEDDDEKDHDVSLLSSSYSYKIRLQSGGPGTMTTPIGGKKYILKFLSF